MLCNARCREHASSCNEWSCLQSLGSTMKPGFSYGVAALHRYASTWATGLRRTASYVTECVALGKAGSQAMFVWGEILM